MHQTNYHMHTKRCLHASADDEDYVLAISEGGYEGIGFLIIHLGNIRVTMWHTYAKMRASQFDDYYNSH